jgi:hypothetical protein
LAVRCALGSGYADLLAVESTGRLVVIEVKLSTNAESRRAVVAQVLCYAGYLQGLDLAQLESQILREQLGASGSVLGAVQADEHQDVVDPGAFHEGISRSLAMAASDWSLSWTPGRTSSSTSSATCRW